MFNFSHTDHDFCRVYYRNTDEGLYCIQDIGYLGIEFLRCSQNGEPEYPLEMPGADEFDQYILPGDKKMKAFDVTVNAEATDSLQATVAVMATTSAEAVAKVKKTIEEEGAGEFEFQFNQCGPNGLENIEVEEQATEIKS